MILQLLGALFLTTCIGSGAVQNSETATNFNNEPKTHYKLRNSTYDENGEGAISIDEWDRYGNWQSQDNTHWLNRAYESSAGTNTMMIKANAYTYLQTNGTGAKIINKARLQNNTSEDYKTTCRVIFVLQITPYVTINSDYGTMSIGLTINNENLDSHTTIGAQLKEWTTTNSNFANYLKINNLNAQNSLFTLEKDIETKFYSQYSTEYITGTNRNNGQIDIWKDYSNLQLAYNTPTYFVYEFIISYTTDNYTYPLNQYIQYPQAFYDIDNNNTNHGTFFTIGWEYTEPTGTGEYVDIPGMMFDILTMPFAFISQAFNLTLFPGTPYQVNISNLLLTLIGVLVFVTIITMIVKR